MFASTNSVNYMLVLKNFSYTKTVENCSFFHPQSVLAVRPSKSHCSPAAGVFLHMVIHSVTE